MLFIFTILSNLITNYNRTKKTITVEFTDESFETHQ